jgi:hypothetical protein
MHFDLTEYQSLSSKKQNKTRKVITFKQKCVYPLKQVILEAKYKYDMA